MNEREQKRTNAVSAGASDRHPAVPIPQLLELPLRWGFLRDDATSAEGTARSTGGGNLVDEIADVSLDFVAWQAVA